MIPATMAGGAITGVLTVTFGATMAVPHGGFLAADHLGKPLLFVTAVAAGSLVTMRPGALCTRRARAGMGPGKLGNGISLWLSNACLE